MNNNKKNMNKINIGRFEYPSLRIDELQTVADLGGHWQGITLYGHYWRLYCNQNSGAGVLLNGKRMEMKPDKLYLLPPNCNLPVWCEKENIRQFYIHFEMSGIGGNKNFLCNELPLKDSDRELIGKIRKTKNIHKKILLCMSLASDCMSRLPEDALKETGNDPRIASACSMLEDNPAHAFTLEELAQSVGMASNSFLRLFRENMGATPYQYLLNIRYSAAARLLRTTELSIEEICEEIGIRDRFHFSRLFKRYSGFSPAAYRKTKRIR